MNIITLDFETYYDHEYTLSKLTTEEYIRDPRFEVLGCGIRDERGLHWVGPGALHGAEWPDKLRQSAVLCHHAQFDGLILSHHYGIRPAAWLDTLSMARMVVGNHISKSLGSLAEHYGLSAKNVPYDLFKGKHWHELTTNEQRLVSDGCLHDVELTWDIYKQLASEFPREEYRVIDMTIRMFTEPMLEGDLQLLGKIWHEANNKKQDIMKKLGVTSKQLASAEQFAELLRKEGVEPETKEGKNGPIYAFAKTDQFMRDLENSEDDYVSQLVSARLGNKSTILQTRTERFGGMASRGRLPVYISYCGAHTTRWSGGDKTNWQNFGRGSNIRKAIKAPKGYLCAVVDASQIECRILNQFAGQLDVIEKFRNGEDPYIGIASAFYGRAITKSDVAERGTGKQLELSCGYGAGADTIVRTAAKGTYGPPIQMTAEEGERAKVLYRTTHPQITRLWGTAGRLLARLAGGPPLEWAYGVEIRGGRLYGPNGAWIDYSTLEYDKEQQTWRFKKRNGWTKIWGGFLVENLIQFLARIHLSQTMLRLQREGIPKICLCTHDDIFALVRDDSDAEKWLAYMIQEMSRSPDWMPEVPLAAEGGLGVTYGDTK